MRSTLDSVEEFRVTTGNYNADSGRSSGAQVNLMTKSGTNAFHGSLYEYYRPNFTVANDWFNKEAELSSGLPNVPGHILRNTFGGTVGGPIKKDRAFFFFAYEGQRTAEDQQVTQTVPTQSLQEGYLKYLCDPGSDKNCDPTNKTINVVPGGTTFAGFDIATLTPAQVEALDTNCEQAPTTCPHTPGNPLGGGPNGLITNIGGANPGALFTKYPLPNSSSEGDLLNTAGYTFAGANPEKLNTYIARLDYKITANGNHSLFFRANLQNDNQAQAPEFPGQPSSDFHTSNNKGIAAGYTALLRPNLINNFRWSLVREGVGDSGINSQPYVHFRTLSDITDLASQSEYVNVPVHNFVDDVTWTKGKHTLQFGTNLRLVHNNRAGNFENVSYGVTDPFSLDTNAGIANEGGSLDPGIAGTCRVFGHILLSIPTSANSMISPLWVWRAWSPFLTTS